MVTLAGSCWKMLIFLLACSLFAWPADSPGASQPETRPFATAGKTVETEYFKLTLPDGWMMPQKVQKRPDGIAAVFASDDGLAVTFNIIKTDMPAERIAAQTVDNMRKSGLQASDPQKQGSLYRVNIKGSMDGTAWFGSDGKLCSATIILGSPPENGKKLLGALKPVDPNLFPRP